MTNTIRDILTFKSFNEFYSYLLQNYNRINECFIEVKKGKPQDGSLSYIDAVYVALCFGWIDSTCRNVDGKIVQRFSPRQKKSPWTELNKERCKWLEKQGKMTNAGRLALENCKETFEISQRMKDVIDGNETLKKHFYSFPEIYQRLRIDSIQRHFKYKDRKEMYEKQITNFIKQTLLGKMYGNMSDYGRLF
ncbi:MAG: hypothetical protein IJT15_04125 [Rickettsiales bacterium]|nr:hypothetical protein [Rickettsiales bacterium]